MKKSHILLTLAVVSALSSFQCGKDCPNTERCQLVPDSGPCDGSFPKYYFDHQENQCRGYIWGGCGGVVPYETLQECEEDCGCR